MKIATKRKIAAGKRPSKTSFFDTAAAEAEFNLDWFFAGSAVPTLFHYTGNAGLMGIVSSTSFWATDSQFLNDAQEIEIALNVAKEVVHEHLLLNKTRYAEALGVQIHVQMLQNPVSRYIFSLSENGNSLSQWRGYASQGAGYAIGFSYEQLQDWCSDQGYTLGKVKYTTSEYAEYLRDIVLAYVDDLSSFFPFFGPGEINEDVLRVYARRFTNKLMHYAPFIKHSGFSDESEWRIVASHFVASNIPNPVIFRSGGHSLVPYQTLNWTPKRFFDCIGSINIKPSHHAEMSEKAVGAYIQSEKRRHGVAEQSVLPIEISNIPFRFDL